MTDEVFGAAHLARMEHELASMCARFEQDLMTPFGTREEADAFNAQLDELQREHLVFAEDRIGTVAFLSSESTAKLQTPEDETDPKLSKKAETLMGATSKQVEGLARKAHEISQKIETLVTHQHADSLRATPRIDE